MFGISRQSYYAYENKVSKLDYEANFIVEKVMEIRKDHPKMGGRKLYYIINPLMESEGINLGRDKFFDVLSKYNLLIKRRIRSIRTTYSNHWLRKYSNLVKDKKVDFPNEVWVSDITYWHIGDRFLYITLTPRACSRAAFIHVRRCQAAAYVFTYASPNFPSRT